MKKFIFSFIATPTLVTDEKLGIQLSLDDFKKMFMDILALRTTVIYRISLMSNKHFKEIYLVPVPLRKRKENRKSSGGTTNFNHHASTNF